MKEFLAKWIPVAAIVLAVCVLLFVLVRLILAQRKKKRFSENALVKSMANEMTESILAKIRSAAAPDCEEYKVSVELLRVFRESFMRVSDSIYFRHEHLRNLETESDRYLMAIAIAQNVKKLLRAKLPSVDPVNGKPYKLTVEHKWDDMDGVRCALVCIYYVVPNENYIAIKKW